MIPSDAQQGQAKSFHDRLSPTVITALVLICGFIVAPYFQNAQDVYGCWLNWARITDGNRPWNLYLASRDVFGRPLDCNYPPFVLYLLAAVQCVLNFSSAAQFGKFAIALVKLPGLVSIAAGAWLCRKGLTPIQGQRAASTTAILYALCLPLWFNASVWGQWDAVLCLAMLCAVIAVLRDKPFVAGAALGWAISIKFQAVVLFPAVCIYGLKRWSIPKMLKLMLGALASWMIVALPFFFAGAGPGVMNSYFGAVNHYPLLTICACNGWMVLQTFNHAVRNWTFPFGRTDDAILIGALTARQIGFVLLATYTFFLMYRLFRKPTPENFMLSAGMTALGFFMIPTEMHERYILPACAIFAVANVKRRYYVALCCVATLNQLVALMYENRVAYKKLGLSDREMFQQIFLVISILQIALFVAATKLFISKTRSNVQPVGG